MHWKERVGIGGLAKIDVGVLDCIISFTRGLIIGLDKTEDRRKRDDQDG